MNIPAKQIQSKRRVGCAGRRGVFQVDLIGGLHVIAAENDGVELEILGMSSHPLMARHIAKKYDNDVEFNDLAKSERIDPRDFGDLLPHWEAETAAVRAAGGASIRLR